MESNPLLGSSSEEQQPSKSDSGQRIINLVSNSPANQIEGLEDFLETFSKENVKVVVNPFRHVIQRKQRRSIGGKFGKGLSQEVTENVEINPNEDLFGLRRWLGSIRQDPASIMLLNINKVKEEPLASPLAFNEMLKTGRPILVTGTDRLVQDQLMAKIDPAFKTIPATVQNNPALKSSLVVRTQRPKGFISSVRPLLDIEFIPREVMDKLVKINGGGDPSELTEPETVNIVLLADMLSRYRQALTLYKENLKGSSMNIQQLSSMFDLLMADVPLSVLTKEFEEFYAKGDENVGEIKTKGDVFAYINRFINTKEGSSRAEGKDQKTDTVFKRITSVMVSQRIKADPVLFDRCSFLYNRSKEEKELHEGLMPVFHYLGKVVDTGDSAINADFKQNMGKVVFEMVSLANLSLDEAQRTGGMQKMRTAQYILPMFSMAKFQSSHLIQISEQNRKTLLNKDTFLNLFSNLPITIQDLREIWKRLNRLLNHNQIICDDIKRSTLDVLEGHAADREKALRDIYIVNAAQELVNYPFHLGETNLSMVERLCGLNVIQHRLGFEAYPKAVRPNSVGMFTKPEHLPLGKLENDPVLLSRAYTALISLQIDRYVKKTIDHKVGYLQSTFGENFFEVIYQNVVTYNDLPLSRNQLAWFIKNRNLLGSLSEKGWRSEHENELKDTFLTLELPQLPGVKREVRNTKEFEGFEKNYQEYAQKFLQLLNDLKAAGERDPTKDLHALIWSLFRRGIYNLTRVEARDAFRKSSFYGQLKEIIARISSENYSVFTKDIQSEGVKIYLHPDHHFLLTIGNRFNFLVEQKVVRYQLIGSPIPNPADLDPLSRVFHEKFSRELKVESDSGVLALAGIGKEIDRIRLLWHEYSRHLAFTMLDRIISETVIKELTPGRILAKNLWYVKDDIKFCLGPAITTQQTVPFAKILQVPENMGNIQKNPRSCSTTIDDFTIEIHKITRLMDELLNIQGISEDVLDILQNLTHERAESSLVTKYEQGLGQMIQLLSRPLRYFTEKEVMALHQVALALRSILQSFFNTPGTQKDQLVQRVQNQLRSRRSDGHLLKMNFTDGFILDMTQIKVMEKKKVDGEVVTRQRKVEVEVDATYQTLPRRIREVIRVHDILTRKRHVVFSPEGQKRKQMEYVMEIINVLQELRGNALNFYVDYSMISEDQMKNLATRVKPHNFFNMDEMKPEAAEGMMVTGEKDPLTGRMVSKPSLGKDAGRTPT